MKVIDPGYIYEVENFDDKSKRQILHFICKTHKAGDPTGTLTTITDGTTNEELLKVLIDRLRFLHKKLPSRQSALAITKVEEALHWLQSRTEDRHERKVEGTALP